MRFRAASVGWIALLLFSGWVSAFGQTQSLPDTGSAKGGPSHGAFLVGHGVSPPQVTYSPNPKYSEKARKVGYEGTCVLWLVVDAEGMPQRIRVVRALGMGLDEEAVETVNSWRFKPGMKGDVPVAVQINVQVNFHLDGKSGSTLAERADAGDAKAQFEISQILLSDPDLVKDDSKGFAYLEKAAKQGLPKAEFGMGEYLSSHRDDLVSAYLWYAAAQKNRYKDSDKKMKELAEKMTPEQLADARGRAEK
ncbi:MAG: TonB family protein [Terriglobales bacterium]